LTACCVAASTDCPQNQIVDGCCRLPLRITLISQVLKKAVDAAADAIQAQIPTGGDVSFEAAALAHMRQWVAALEADNSELMQTNSKLMTTCTGQGQQLRKLITQLQQLTNQLNGSQRMRQGLRDALREAVASGQRLEGARTELAVAHAGAQEQLQELKAEVKDLRQRYKNANRCGTPWR